MKVEEEHGHIELLKGAINEYIWGRLNSKGHTGQVPPGGELTWAYYGPCRDTDRVGNRRAEKP